MRTSKIKVDSRRLPSNVFDLQMCKTGNYCESHFYITCFAVSTMVSQQHIFTKPVDGCSTSKMAAKISLSTIFLFLPDSFLLQKKGKLGRFVVCAFRAACKLNRIQLQYNHFLFYFCCMCPRIKNHLFLRKHPFGKSYRIVLRAPFKATFLVHADIYRIGCTFSIVLVPVRVMMMLMLLM